MLISSLSLKSLRSVTPKIEALSISIRLPNTFPILSVLLLVGMSIGRPCIWTQKTEKFKAASLMLNPGGHCQRTMWYPLKFQGLFMSILSLSCWVGKVNRNIFVSISSMIRLGVKLQDARMVAWRVCLFKGFEDISFPTSVRLEKWFTGSASVSSWRLFQVMACACWMSWSISGLCDVIFGKGWSFSGLAWRGVWIVMVKGIVWKWSFSEGTR